MLVNLANGLQGRGVPVYFLTPRGASAYLGRLSPTVSRLSLPDHEADQVDYVTALLGQLKNAAVMTAKLRDDALALKIKHRLAAGNVRFYFRVGSPLSVKGRLQSGPLGFRRYRRQVRSWYGGCDGVIVNSIGVGEDLAQLTGLPRQKIHYAPNPAVPDDLPQQAAVSLSHPWFQEGQPPVIVGVGRLSRAKDFGTLIRAFAQLQKKRPARLVLIGDGPRMQRLKVLSQVLGVSQDVDFLGFVDNPYPFIRQASLLVSSSRWEGCPNVVIEALALGTPVVATACPCGTAEVLQYGKFGSLVPVRNSEALARAMLECLSDPLPSDLLRQAARPYTLDSSIPNYLKALQLLPGHD